MISNVCIHAKQFANEIDVDIVRPMVLTSLRRYRMKFKNEYGDFVLCGDSKNVWRKEVFPYYKENRKKEREKSLFDWRVIDKAVRTIFSELQETFPYKSMMVERAEADDIIAVLCKHYHDEPIMIVSRDKDLRQLQRYPNVRQYDPIDDRYMDTDNPKQFLFEQILRGDSGDGVPNFLSDDDSFVNPDKRQKSIYETKMAEWVKTPMDILADKKYAHNLKRNRKLIDLTQIPEDIEQSILEEYKKEKQGSRKKLMPYFMEHRLSTLLENMGDF